MLEQNKLNEQIENKAEKLYKALLEKGFVLATAESCTGGLVSAYLTGIDGSSKVFDRSFITYSNSAKTQMLGVSPQSLLQYGAVSEIVAKEMQLGALENSQASIAVSITGIAGPKGGTKDKPVGTVCIAWGDKKNNKVTTQQFKGDRSSVRLLAVNYAFECLLAYIEADV